MITQSKKRVQILTDPDPQNPRTEWDHFGTMICWHRRYNLGDEQPKEGPTEWKTNLAIEACPRLEEIIHCWDNDGFQWLVEKNGNFDETNRSISQHINSLVLAILEKHFVFLPLCLYDHSGITMNTTGFSCPCDSGQVGWIYVSSETIRKEYVADTPENRKRAEECLRAEVEAYNQYLTDDCYGFIVEKFDSETQEWIETDSCWGFFGNDPKTNGMKDYLGEELMELAHQAT